MVWWLAGVILLVIAAAVGAGVGSTVGSHHGHGKMVDHGDPNYSDTSGIGNFTLDSSGDGSGGSGHIADGRVLADWQIGVIVACGVGVLAVGVAAGVVFVKRRRVRRVEEEEEKKKVGEVTQVV